MVELLRFDVDYNYCQYTVLRMNKRILMDLLAVPTSTHKEHAIVAWLVDYIRRNIRNATVTTDEHRNVYVTKGDAKFSPCAVAHIDSVHSLEPVNIIEHNGCLFGLDAKGNRAGIGGDDKAGVYVCLRLLHYVNNIRVVLFAGEEQGCIGARQANPEFFAGVGWIMEFDCPSTGMASYTAGGMRLFANNGAFIKSANDILPHYGTTLWQHHPFTDVTALRQRFPISCLNLSCGYHNWHCRDEFVVIEEVERAVSVGGALVLALGNTRYEFPLNPKDPDEPVMEVTRLHVPEPTKSPAGYRQLLAPSCA